MSHGAVYYETEISGIRALGKDPIRGFEITARAPRNHDYDQIKIPVSIDDNQPLPTINDQLIVSVVWGPYDGSFIAADGGGGGGQGYGAGPFGRSSLSEDEISALMDNPHPMDNPKPKAKVTFVVQFQSPSGEVTHTYKETRTVEDGDEFIVSLPNEHQPTK